MDAYKGPPQDKGGRLCRFETYQQRAGQTRATRGGHGVELAGGDCGLGHGQPGYREQIPEMLARGQFGHDAAVLRVKPDLRRDDIGQHAAPAHDRGAGFVTGGLDGQQGHG